MMKARIRALVGIAALAAGSLANADEIVLNFSGLNGTLEEGPANYYNGGAGALGSTGGTNYGVSFGADAITCTGQPGGVCNTAQIPGGPGANVLFFLTGPGDIMNKASGFTDGFSFYYSAANVPGVVDIFSGLNGTGDLLASINLPTTNNGANTAGCFGTNFCPYVATGVTFKGTAQSVNFSGTQNQIGFADITLGTAVAGGTGGSGSGGGGGGATSAPEIDPGKAGSALTLLLGCLAVMFSGRRKASAAI